MIIPQTRGLLLGAIIIITVSCLLYISNTIHTAAIPHLSFTTPYGIITVPAALPETPINLTLYKVTPQPNDMVYFSSEDSEKIHLNTTSEADAPSVVKKSLEKYGGLPNDAVMAYDKTEYLEQLEDSIIPFFPAHVIAKYPISTNVQFNRAINGHRIAGDGGFINIELGNDGELLYLDKTWRTVTPIKTVRIISALQAIEKMQRGEILGNHPICACDITGCPCDLTVTKIVPTYYEKGRNISQEYLDPVWVFAGTLSDGNPWHYSVYAWQFANFTEAPVSGLTPLSIQFTDTSDSSPTRWLWDFGDGTTSTEQNPVHSYKTAGTYNVTHTGWNDLGSDTIMKNIFVRNNPGENPVLNSSLNILPGTHGTRNISE